MRSSSNSPPLRRRGGTTDAPHCHAMVSTMRLTIDPLKLDRSRVQVQLRQNNIIITVFMFLPRPRHLRADGGTTDAPHCDATTSAMRLTIGQLELDRFRVQIKLRKPIPSPSCSFLVTCAPTGTQRTRHAAIQRREHSRLTTGQQERRQKKNPRSPRAPLSWTRSSRWESPHA